MTLLSSSDQNTRICRGFFLMAIRIQSFVNQNSFGYFDYLVKNYRDMAENPSQLTFEAYAFSPAIVACLRDMPHVDEVVEVFREPRYFVRRSWRDYVRYVLALVGVFRPMGGSNGHAAGLNAAFSRTGTSDVINIIADSDTVMLKRGWDVFVAEKLRNFGVIGTCYEDIGGFSSGSTNVQTYKELPNLTWLALAPRYDFSEFDCDPGKHRNIQIDSAALASLYNLPVGYELVRDVGWKLPQYLQDNGISCRAFKQVKPTSEAVKAVKSGNDYNEEYQWDGEPILAHQRGSHRHAFRTSEVSSAFYQACEAYLGITDSRTVR